MSTCAFCERPAGVRAYDLSWCLDHLIRLYLGLRMVAP